jgi:hypothetical protein
MAVPVILTGANIVLWINGTQYKQVTTVSFTVDYSEDGIFGIDSPYAQEIAGNRITVRGQVNGLRVKLSGGLQAVSLRPLFNDSAASPYVSIRIQDRATTEDIIFIPNCKVNLESHSAGIKSTYKLNFNFIGQMPLFALDRSN